MNKKLLSFAVAAALAAPLAAQADVTIYGQLDLSVDYVDYNTADDIFTWPHGAIYSARANCTAGVFPCGLPGVFGFGPRGFPRGQVPNGTSVDSEIANWQVNSNASRIGFKGDEDLGNGLSAIWKLEYEVDIDGDTADWTRRNMYLGLSHEAGGTLLLGRHDTPYKVVFGSWDLFEEGFADDDLVFGQGPFNAGRELGLSGFTDRRANNVIAYISPTFAGLTFAAAAIPGETNFNDGLSGTGFSLGLGGGWGPIKAALGYEQLNEDDALKAIGNPQGTFFANPAHVVATAVGSQLGGFAGDRGLNAPWAASRYADDDTVWGAAIAFDSSPFYVGLRYEDHSDLIGLKGFGIEQWRLSASYTLGNTTLKAMYHTEDADLAHSHASFSQDAWAVGVDHNLSKRTLLYVSYVDVSSDVDSKGLTFNGGPGYGARGGAFVSPWFRALGAGVLPGGRLTGLSLADPQDGDAFSLGILHKF